MRAISTISYPGIISKNHLTSAEMMFQRCSDRASEPELEDCFESSSLARNLTVSRLFWGGIEGHGPAEAMIAVKVLKQQYPGTQATELQLSSLKSLLHSKRCGFDCVVPDVTL
eukprot:3835777-Rhodomonas_salina.2